MSADRRRSLIALGAALAAIVLLLGLRNLLVDAPLERLRPVASGDGQVREGSWYFPRGGPYILGFESPAGPAVLRIDGAVVARGEGEQLARRVYQPGSYAVRFEAPAGARLLWHPPGRRGPPEYVPPSSLSPLPPDEARFGAGAGASRADGVFALGLVLVLGALALYLLRARLHRIDRATALAFALVTVAGLGIRLYDLGGAGQTWDEDVNWSAGRNYITNLLSLDFAAASWRWNYEHPPVMKYVAGIGAQLADGYGPARALSALVMALACAMLVPIGRRLLSLRVGVVAAALAAVTPHLIGHGKVVGHEAPSLLLWMLGIWAALRVHDRPAEEEGEGADRWRLHRRMALVGLVFGLALSARFVNGLMAPLLGAILLLEAPPAARKRTVVLGLTLVPVVALAVSFLVWPRLWSAPIEHLQEAWAKLRKPHSPEPYLGAITNVPPRDYFARYLVATAPLGLLVAAAAALVRAGVRRERGMVVLGLWVLVPLLVMLSPVRQDGIRYILPSVAALALAAGAGLDFVVGAAGARLVAAGRRAVGAAAAVALVGYVGASALAVHPYYLDYYGEHVGGPAGVARAKSFEIAWWGEGLAEALAVINAEAAPGARVHKGCVEPSHLAWLRGDLWASEARDPARAEWILVYQPSWRSCPVPADAELVHEVSVRGAPLARVYRRR